MSFNEEHNLAKIRQKLQEDGVKLWLPPFFQNGAPVEDKLKETAVNYADNLAISCDVIVAALMNLQSHALEKLASRTQFLQTGLATLRVKAVGTEQPPKNITFQLDQTGAALRLKICTEMNIPSHSRVKIICHGSILVDEKPLKDQGVSNNSLIMAIIPPTDPDSQRFEEQLIQEVELIKEDAKLLAGQDDDSNSLRIADQSGNVINLPIEEKKSLAVAMALHEKGRAALKRNQTTLALTLFHEADAQFNSCRSELLQAVDNAALLNLDIAWCYLLLGSPADIPDAAVRLDRCERSLYKTYGPRMERLLTLKGTTGNEGVLFLRLHLLQGVVAYHQGKTLEAVRMLEQTKNELDQLTVNDNDLSQLINLGYSVSEARLGLRAHRGDLNAACVFLQRREEDRQERIRKEEEEEELNKERRKLGKTASGQWVNLGYLKTISDMGYERSRAAEALKQTNNEIGRALEYLQSDLEMMDQESSILNSFYSEESLAQVISMGFPEERAKEALKRCGGDVESAVEYLSAQLGNATEEPLAGPSTRDRKAERAAYKRMAKDIPKSESDHLDTNLETETLFLQKYLSFLS